MNATTEDIDVADEASDSEIVRYAKAYRATRRTLDECIETLMIMEALESDTTVRNQIALKRLELESERDNLRAANIAFHASQTLMRPPSPALVAQINEITQQAVDLTVERTTVTAVLRLATSALKKFAEIQDI